MACGIALPADAGPDDLPAVLTGLVGVAAMAVQNAAGRLVFGALSPTTVMTGNVTQVVIDLVARPAGSIPAPTRLWWPLLAFAAACIGRRDQASHGRVSACLLLPMAALLLAAALQARRPVPEA